MYLNIIDVIAINDYKLVLIFENKERRIFDMKPYMNKGIFKDLYNKNIFETVHIAFDTIEWSNNADFDPELLYQESIPL